MANVDALSRLPIKVATEIEENSLNRVSMSADICINTNEVAIRLKSEKTLFQVYQYVRDGWPNKNLLAKEEKYYYNLKTHLSTQDNCLFFGDSLVIPKDLQPQILTQLHSNHEGIVRMKMSARGVVWFRGLDKAIEDKVKSCRVCNETQNVAKEIVTSRWPPTSYPFERIHIDFFSFQNKYFLIVVDSYTKFIEVKAMKSLHASAVIDHLEDLFRYFGLPAQLCSDNGPPFSSYQFNQWGAGKGINIVKSPPYHPQSNGAAERGVQTIKAILKKFVLSPDIKDYTLEHMLRKLLSKYNNTPSTVTTKSPNEILFTYTPRTLLNAANSKINAKSSESVEKKKVQFNLKKNVVHIWNKNEIFFKKGEKVYYKNHHKEYLKWLPGVVHQRVSKYLYLVNVRGTVRTVHQNQLKIRKTSDNDLSVPLAQPLPTPTNRSEEESSKIRKSHRTRKPPCRFGYEEYSV